MTTRYITLAALIAFASPLPAQDSASVAKLLDAQYARFSQAYVTLDPDAVANLYTEDALYLSPGADIKRGRPAVREEFKRFFDSVRSRGDSIRIVFTIVDRKISGGLAGEVGYFDLTTKSGGTARTGRGKFVVIWVRGSDGNWRFRTDTYNDITPPRREPQ
jgi:uncharacterized protein (TIGR02246 family)